MAEGKKGFVLYADQKELFDQLTNEKAGELIKHIFSYVNDEDPESKDIIINLAFTPIKQQLKRDLDKYEKRASNSRENGKKGGRPKKPEKPSGLNKNPSEPRKPDTDTVTDTVTDNDTVKVKEIKNNKLLMSEANASNVSDLNKHYFTLAHAFYELFKKNQDVLGVKWNHLKKCPAKKFIDPIRLMIEVDERTEEEIVEVGNFLKTDEFWMPNIQTTSKLREKFDQLITKCRNDGKGNTVERLNKKLSDSPLYRSL